MWIYIIMSLCHYANVNNLGIYSGRFVAICNSVFRLSDFCLRMKQ